MSSLTSLPNSAFQTALHLHPAPRNQRIEKQIARRREWVEEDGPSFDQDLQYASKNICSPRCSRKRCFLRLPAYLGGYGMSNTISEPFSGERTQTGKGIGTGNRNQTQINFVSPSTLSIFPVHPARCEGTIGNMKTHFRVSWIEFTHQEMSSHFKI